MPLFIPSEVIYRCIEHAYASGDRVIDENRMCRLLYKYWDITEIPDCVFEDTLTCNFIKAMCQVLGVGGFDIHWDHSTNALVVILPGVPPLTSGTTSTHR